MMTNIARIDEHYQISQQLLGKGHPKTFGHYNNFHRYHVIGKYLRQKADDI